MRLYELFLISRRCLPCLPPCTGLRRQELFLFPLGQSTLVSLYIISLGPQFRPAVYPLLPDLKPLTYLNPPVLALVLFYPPIASSHDSVVLIPFLCETFCPIHRILAPFHPSMWLSSTTAGHLFLILFFPQTVGSGLHCLIGLVGSCVSSTVSSIVSGLRGACLCSP